MPHWLIKTALQHTISWLPNRQWWNRSFQQFTGSLRLTDLLFTIKVQECARQLNLFQQHSGSVPNNFTAVELGTGWFPTIACGYFLCGAKVVHTYDIDPLLDPLRLERVLRFFCTYADDGRLDPILPGWSKERLQQIRVLLPSVANQAPEKTLAALNIIVRVQDAQQTGLPDQTADFLTSSGVLEYIPKPILAGITREFRRIARPEALMLHRINLRDIFSYFDMNITPFNLLRYSNRVWRWIDSPMTPQNRLRISDYRKLIQDTGWDVTGEFNESGSIEQLRSVPLAAEFQHYSDDDLLVLESWMTTKPARHPSTEHRSP